MTLTEARFRNGRYAAALAFARTLPFMFGPEGPEPPTTLDEAHDALSCYAEFGLEGDAAPEPAVSYARLCARTGWTLSELWGYECSCQDAADALADEARRLARFGVVA